MAKVKKAVKKAQNGSRGFLKGCNWDRGERKPLRLPQINMDFLKRKEKPEKPEKSIPPETPKIRIPDLPKGKIPPMEMKLKRRRPIYDYEPGRWVDEKTPETSSVKPGAKKVPSKPSTTSGSKKSSSVPKKPSSGTSKKVPYESSSKTPSTSTRTRIPGRMIKLGYEEYRRGGKVSKRSAPKVARRSAKMVSKMKKK